MMMTFPTLFSFVGDGAPTFPDSFLPTTRIFCATRALSNKHVMDLPQFKDDRRTPQTVSDYVRYIAPSLDGSGHKGSSGRIAVLGGSKDYTGAPYYAGMSALRAGAELLYLFTAEEACTAIKSYSPELMVTPVYSHATITKGGPAAAGEVQAMVNRVCSMLPRMHALVIGPGLGRNDHVLSAVAKIIMEAKALGMPLVLDADALFLITRQPALLKGYFNAVVTPNKREFSLLAKAVTKDADADLETLTKALAGPVVVQKGAVDRICALGVNGKPPTIVTCQQEGAPRRPGGLGDLLCGTMGVLLGWAHAKSKRPTTTTSSVPPNQLPFLHACQAACVLVRTACFLAYNKEKRSMVAPDVLTCIGPAFQHLCPDYIY